MKLLMHLCCGPCGVYPLEEAEKENIEVTGFFYNPNIHPYEEFLKRRENVKLLSQLKRFPVIYYEDFLQKEWEQYSNPLETRCSMCYRIRMENTARVAKERGFDAFTTSLLVSPYQNHELILQMGERFQERYGIDFYYRDYRVGFRLGQQKAKELELYRQKFCGCIVSYWEAEQQKKSK